MKISLWFALSLGTLFAGCGGVARLGNSGADDGANDSGGPSTDGGISFGGGGAGTGGYRSTGGRRATGGRSAGGRFGSGGRIATGGRFFGGAGGFEADASIGGRGDGGFSTGGRTFDAGDDPLRNRVPAGKVCDRLTTIMCAGEQYCCPRNDRSIGACKQAMMNSCAPYMDGWTLNPVLGYDMDRAEAAFAEFEKRASSCDTSIMPWALSNAGFRTVARGTVEPGSSCFSYDGGGAIYLDAIAMFGSCTEPGAYACMYDTPTNWNCAPRSDVGGKCFLDINCLDGLYCEAMGSLSTCLPRKPNGATCSNLLMCESMHCDTTVGLCVPATLESVYCLGY
jgi:hypothetical protein